jgi:hypothetical protein
MNKEEHLINKTYFHTIVEEDNKKYPVKALGTAFYQEQLNEGSELSSIRFAQGEVYYHHKDMEAAVYKWANVKDELGPWASKNIGDAYYLLGWLNEAEKTYIGIQTKSTTLSIEICLQLLTLYSENNQPEKANKYIEKALSINSDYPNVTEIARLFYEDRQEWKKSVELAVNEAVRTKSLEWYSILNNYIKSGHTVGFSPMYFEQVLTSLYDVDKRIFSEVLTSLSLNYRNGPSELAWMKTMNEVIAKINVSEEDRWEEITQVYYESYLQLMDGQYLIYSLKTLVPNLIGNWLKLTKGKSSLFPATAALAWEESFPGTLDTLTIENAENHVLTGPMNISKVEEMNELLDTILNWAEENDVNVGNKQKWLLSQMQNYDEKYLFVAGSGASSLLNTILEEELFTDDDLTAFIRAGEHPVMNKITDEDTNLVSDMNDLNERDLIELSWPSRFLNELNGSLVYGSLSKENKLLEDHARIASGVLYVIGNKQSVIKEEVELLNEWSEKHRDIPIHFVVNDAEVSIGTEELKLFLSERFPTSHQFSLTTNVESGSLHDFIQTQFKRVLTQTNQNKARILLYSIRSVITHLMDQRVTKENTYKEAVTFNDQVRNKLKGLVNHLEDSKVEKSLDLLESYRTLKEEMKKKVWEEVPALLQTVADDLDEEGDFRQVHEELDMVMNRKIERYIDKDLIPAFESRLRTWIHSSRNELTGTQKYLTEMSQTFNKMYGEERMDLKCDFQVFKDWERDLSRMMNRSEVQHINIMNRLIPSQLILKSAGKLLGNMQKNKQILYAQYQKHIKNSDYEHVSAEIIKELFMEFDLFEKALKSDVHMSFEEPLLEVKECIEEAELEIKQAKEKLEKMKNNPDDFYDPLKIFEVRILQFDMIDEMTGKMSVH